MRYDILNVGADAGRLEGALKAALGAVDEPDRFGPKSHLKAPNGGRLRVSPSLGNEAEAAAAVSLHSDLADVAHNAWAIQVFDAVCAAIDSDVTLFDEDDTVIRARHHAAA